MSQLNSNTAQPGKKYDHLKKKHRRKLRSMVKLNKTALKAQNLRIFG